MILPFDIAEKWLADAVALLTPSTGNLKTDLHQYVTDLCPSSELAEFIIYLLTRHLQLVTGPEQQQQECCRSEHPQLFFALSDVGSYAEKLRTAPAAAKAQVYGDIVGKISSDLRLWLEDTVQFHTLQFSPLAEAVSDRKSVV